jgi:hypothetical protein
MCRKYQGIRRPKTTQERRANQDGYARGKRRKLPDSWTDINRLSNRCWKGYRTQQWKDS